MFIYDEPLGVSDDPQGNFVDTLCRLGVFSSWNEAGTFLEQLDEYIANVGESTDVIC